MGIPAILFQVDSTLLEVLLEIGVGEPMLLIVMSIFHTGYVWPNDQNSLFAISGGGNFWRFAFCG
jgi:hypothetical protein